MTTRLPRTEAYEITPEGILYQMLWSRRMAAKWLRMLGAEHFSGLVAYGPSIAAVIDDHDRRHPEAPADGEGRVMSIVEHASRLAADVRANPGAYTDPVQSMYARATGEVNLQLLRLAPAVVHELPRLVVTGDEPTDS